MCTFCSDLSNQPKSANRRKAPITLFLKPNNPDNENEKYRFRILNFRADGKSDRSTSFIERYVHNHWGVNENGFKVVDDYVVCPSSKYIDGRYDESLGFADTYRELKLKDKKPTWDAICPVCKHYGDAWNSYKSSGKTDRVALDRINTLRKQFQGIVPVYVVKDPTNEKNNGRFKCIIFSVKEEYDQFMELVEGEIAKIRASGGGYNWCNGANAVDFYLRMDKVPVTYKNGKQGSVRKITKMAFGTKPYDLLDANDNEIICKEAIDKFEYDEQFYIKNTKSEIEEFYQKYFALAATNVPEEEEDVFSTANPATAVPQKQKVQIPTNAATKPAKVSEAFVDDLVSDSEDIVDEEGESPNTQLEAPTQSVDDLLDQLDFND